MVHEYFIKGKSSIRIEKEESTLGIEYDRENNVIQINLRKLFSDFKEGINQILIKMKSSEKQKEYEITGISGDFLIKTYKEFFTK